jgi:hypothetical protein
MQAALLEEEHRLIADTISSLHSVLDAQGAPKVPGDGGLATVASLSDDIRLLVSRALEQGRDETAALRKLPSSRAVISEESGKGAEIDGLEAAMRKLPSRRLRAGQASAKDVGSDDVDLETALQKLPSYTRLRSVADAARNTGSREAEGPEAALELKGLEAALRKLPSYMRLRAVADAAGESNAEAEGPELALLPRGSLTAVDLRHASLEMQAKHDAMREQLELLEDEWEALKSGAVATEEELQAVTEQALMAEVRCNASF